MSQNTWFPNVGDTNSVVNYVVPYRGRRGSVVKYEVPYRWRRESVAKYVGSVVPWDCLQIVFQTDISWGPPHDGQKSGPFSIRL